MSSKKKTKTDATPKAPRAPRDPNRPKKTRRTKLAMFGVKIARCADDLTKIASAVAGWGYALSENATNALAEVSNLVEAFALLPADFVPPTKRGKRDLTGKKVAIKAKFVDLYATILEPAADYLVMEMRMNGKFAVVTGKDGLGVVAVPRNHIEVAA
jgi:hypothetical protein